MILLDAAFWVVCLVLVASGVTKIAGPESFQVVLVELGVPGGGSRAGHWPAVVVGSAEVAVGMVGLSLGGTAIAWVVAAMYLGFAAVVALARDRGLESCGCFGARSGRPSLLHVVINASSAIVAAAAAWTDPPGVSDGLEGQGAMGVLWVVLALAAAGAVVVADTR